MSVANLGIVMLVHDALGRARQVARHWAEAGCPVVIHVDKLVPNQEFEQLRLALSDESNIVFCERFRCEWGTWGIVEASLAASELLLETFKDVNHLFLASGSCLPLRPVEELADYLENRPKIDFIESVAVSDVPWTVGGLDAERFTLRFLFSWRRNRFFFDKSVTLQRKLGLRRKVPTGVVPHLGSQWWCLTRNTLTKLLQDPRRRKFDRYFRRVWIPDESYFQSLVRLYSQNIESRSLTLAKFDFQGKPHVFYDDHLQLLQRSDCFVARKIWPEAHGLYEALLAPRPAKPSQAEPNPGQIDRIFSKALERRTKGRPGLYMQSRFPNEDWENGVTAAQYSVFQGFFELFEDFAPWLTKTTNCRVHGHLFARDRVHFAEGASSMNGAISDSPALRDYNPNAFLANLLWNTRGERQCFQFGPMDRQAVRTRIAKDPNAQISVISGAWSIPLFRSNLDFTQIREAATELQKIESEYLKILRSTKTKARVRVWNMAEFIEAPMEPLQDILDEIGGKQSHRLTEAPRMVDLSGFGQFVQQLKNEGMHPYLIGDFTVDQNPQQSELAQKPFLVR